jgi:hypothetical protein
MVNPVVVQVHPLSEVRARLSGILIPYEAYERYEALARERARLGDALSAAQSVQVELPGAFSPEHDREVSAYVDGEITAAELYRRTVSRYRRP